MEDILNDKKFIICFGEALSNLKSIIANIDENLNQNDKNFHTLQKSTIGAFRQLALIEGIYWCMVDTNFDMVEGENEDE